MRLEQLAYFIEISKHTSINASAENLHITPQALNIAVRKLEEELQTILLVRTSKGIALTENGRLFVPVAERILNDLENLRQIFQCNNDLHGELIIIFSPLYYSLGLTETVEEFGRFYPNVHLNIYEESLKNLYNHIQSLALQSSPPLSIGLIHAFENAYQLPPYLSYNPLITKNDFQNNWVAIVGTTSPLAKHQQLSIKTILKHPIIIPALSEDFQASFLYQKLCLYGQPNIRLITNNFTLMDYYLNKHDCILLLPYIMSTFPECVLPNSLNAIAVIKIKETFASAFSYMIPSIHTQHPLISAFLQMLLKNGPFIV